MNASDIKRGLDQVVGLPKKITDITDNISKGASSLAKMTDRIEKAVTKAWPKNPVKSVVLNTKIENLANSIKSHGEELANKITPISNAADKISKSSDCLKECQAVLKSSSILVDAIVDTASGHFHPRNNEQVFNSFDNQWDSWAKNTNDIFNRLSPDSQTNVLESFAKNNFGNEIFYLGSAIKNNSSGIFGGIADFEDALHQFRGGFHDPVEAAKKIEAGVKGIIRATERVADSINNMIKTYQKGVNGIDKGNPVLSYIGSLHDKPAVFALNKVLTVGVATTVLASDLNDLKAAVNSKNPLAIYSTGKNSYDYIKTVAEKLETGTEAVKNTPVSKNYEKKSKGKGLSNSEIDEKEKKKSDDSYVCSTAKIQCSFGDAIATLTVLPDRTVWLTGQPQANISDHLSMVNIAPFGKCRSVAYPPTGSATATNHGKLTPMPCVPNTPYPWMGGKNDVLIKGKPALLNTSKCRCHCGGIITIIFDGQSM